MNRNRATLLPPTEEGITVAAARLLSGGVVGMPTETVYGLAALATDATAVARVYAVKQRPLFDPLIAHVAPGDPFERTRALVDLAGFSTGARELLGLLWSRFWPGPLTTVLPRAAGVPDLVTAGLSTVAVRMPRHPVAARLLAATGPLVAPSANRFGRISPTTAQATLQELGDQLEYVLDGGPCEIGVESTVIAVEPDGAVRLLRPGGVPLEALAALVGQLGARHARIEAPGQTPSHYAPRAPVCLSPGPLEPLEPDALEALLQGKGRLGLLLCQGPTQPAVARLAGAGHAVIAARSLSTSGDDVEAARNLFAALRELDEANPDTILVEPWPRAAGLGAAIQDRLARAAAPRG
jgi:L-threonylcarbamoyladenylate synthase